MNRAHLEQQVAKRHAARKWFRPTGAILVILSFAPPVHAQPSTPTSSGPSGPGTEMRPTVTDAQRDMAEWGRRYRELEESRRARPAPGVPPGARHPVFDRAVLSGPQGAARHSREETASAACYCGPRHREPWPESRADANGYRAPGHVRENIGVQQEST
ncbi:hypothetical protein F6X39_06845 [Paraburkholderia sp. UCT2]|nr:hypothetical protein [Paraburkholderia sp. UCT2]